MRYAGLIENDVANGEGICVTLFLQGCPHHCPGCHNPDTWDFNGGMEIDETELINKIFRAITKNGILRNFSISGGEPLCEENIPFVNRLVKFIRNMFPTIKIFCWSGYEYEDLWILANYYNGLHEILNTVDVLITGPFILEQRDITLKLRGSKNQEIWRRDENGIMKLDS